MLCNSEAFGQCTICTQTYTHYAVCTWLLTYSTCIQDGDVFLLLIYARLTYNSVLSRYILTEIISLKFVYGR